MLSSLRGPQRVEGSTNSTGRTRAEWRELIIAYLTAQNGLYARAKTIARKCAEKLGEPEPCSTRGTFYAALRSLADDGTIERDEGRPDGFRRDVRYRIIKGK